MERLRQMSADRLLLEAPPAPQKPLGGLSPEAAARAYTRQADLLQAAAKIKQEHILLEEVCSLAVVLLAYLLVLPGFPLSVFKRTWLPPFLSLPHHPCLHS